MKYKSVRLQKECFEGVYTRLCVCVCVCVRTCINENKKIANSLIMVEK